MLVKDRLKKLRENQGITRYELAKRARCPTTTVDNIELGRRQDPQLSTLIKLARGLGITVSELLKDIEEAPQVQAEEPM